MKLAVIPARGGSKRIKGKNVREFAGKPIIARSIELAIQSGLFDRVIVSTDSESIADIAKSYGAEVPFLRSKELADDFATTNEVVKDAIEKLKEQGHLFQYVCCIYATAPLLQESFLRKGLTLLEQSGADFVFSVCTYDFPALRALEMLNGNVLRARFPDQIYRRSQDLDELVHDAGQFYWGLAESFVQGIDMFASTARGLEIPRIFVQDIDSEEDWENAEIMFEALKHRGLLEH